MIDKIRLMTDYRFILVMHSHFWSLTQIYYMFGITCSHSSQYYCGIERKISQNILSMMITIRIWNTI